MIGLEKWGDIQGMVIVFHRILIVDLIVSPIFSRHNPPFPGGNPILPV
jgi:hypothetical protein